MNKAEVIEKTNTQFSHCDHVYANYTPEIENRHFAYDCPDVPETVKQAARTRLAKRGM
jgi:hypothetical protein